MIRLLAIVTTLTALFVALMSAAIALGRATPLPEEVAFLHLGDMCELPCWIGITPGKTTVEEAWTKITNVYSHGEEINFQHLVSAITVKSPNGMLLWIGLNATYPGGNSQFGQIVTLISLTPLSPTNIPIGYAINVLGSPERIVPPYITKIELRLAGPIYEIHSSLYHPPQVHFGQNANFDEAITASYPLNSIDLVQKGENRSPVDDKFRWRGFSVYRFETPLFFPNDLSWGAPDE